MAAADEVPTPARGTSWFGPDLDWETDSPADYVERLGTDVSLFNRAIDYPLTDEGELALAELSAQTAQARAVAVLTVQPTRMPRLREPDAEKLASELAAAVDRDGSYFLVRYAPEMNGSWTTWGRRPRTYIQTFRALADAVHDATDRAVMVWTPAYGAGYPFTAPLNSSTTIGDAAPPVDKRNLPYLDTDGDGAVTQRDDPYAPYYPGDRAVDWVGLTMLRYGAAPRFGANTVPSNNELDGRLKERLGYGDDVRRKTFYVRFAGQRKQPFLLVTAAMYNPTREGADEGTMKRAWLRQVVEAAASRPLLDGVLWLEQSRLEPEIGARVSWQIARPPALAESLQRLLSVSRVDLGPALPPPAGASTTDPTPDPDAVVPPSAGPDESEAVPASRGSEMGPYALAALGGMLLVVAGLLVALRLRRRRMTPPWLR